jgi:2-polyprenyl-6-hydroxyphenyl methylase/3-demethylubiquinone-9 3-methyltransferase
MTDQPAPAASIDPREVANFAAIAEEWWRPDGKFRPLHRLNPARLGYIRDRLVTHFDLPGDARRPLEGLRLLDIGCGGGLVAEPLARLGAAVTGIDAAERNIQVAAQHAEGGGLAIEYRCAAAEDLVAAGERFDAVLALEVVEHVADVPGFLQACAGLVRPGGLFLASTLNRTVRAFATAIIGAEYVMRWLPPGTHDWRRFLRPHELARAVRASGLSVTDIAGLSYRPLRDEWRISADTGVNYLMAARAPD